MFLKSSKNLSTLSNLDSLGTDISGTLPSTVIPDGSIRSLLSSALNTSLAWAGGSAN